MEKRKYHNIDQENIYRLLTGVILPHAESLRDDGVGVGVLLLSALACSTNLAYID